MHGRNTTLQARLSVVDIEHLQQKIRVDVIIGFVLFYLLIQTIRT